MDSDPADTPPQVTPCGHLIERIPPECEMGYAVPRDCTLDCDFYCPGLNSQERTRCEVWSRVMGYHRPVSHYNPGKLQEHRERRFFREPPPAALADPAPLDPLADAGRHPAVHLPEPGVVPQPSPRTPRVQFLEGSGHD